jgi:phage terminase large subunit GpA-like protein
MRRFYRACPTCRRRMRLIGTSSETFSQPPQPVERYYQCPNCEAEWTFNVERNFQSEGVPDNMVQRGQA